MSIGLLVADALQCIRTEPGLEVFKDHHLLEQLTTACLHNHLRLNTVIFDPNLAFKVLYLCKYKVALLSPVLALQLFK